MIFTEMIPEAYEAYESKRFIGGLVVLSWVGMSAFQHVMEGMLETR